MRIGVVADTHMPRFGRALPAALVQGLTHPPVDLILHLGDFTDPMAAGLLEAIAPLEGVAGNNDGPELRSRFGRRKVLTLDGVRVGLIHGDGTGRSTPERALSAFEHEPVDIVLFGHSHAPLCERRGDRWLFNPGSATDRRRNPRYSYGLLAIAEGIVTPQLRFFDDKRP